MPDVKHLTGGSVETPFQSIASSLPRKARDERPSGRPPPSLELPFHLDQAPPSPELYSVEFPCRGGKRACAAGAASRSGGHAGMLEGTLVRPYKAFLGSVAVLVLFRCFFDSFRI